MACAFLDFDVEKEKRKHKLKRFVQSPNSSFFDLKHPACYNVTPVFSHAQSVIVCSKCNFILAQPTGGKARLVEGSSFRVKPFN